MFVVSSFLLFLPMPPIRLKSDFMITLMLELMTELALMLFCSYSIRDCTAVTNTFKFMLMNFLFA